MRKIYLCIIALCIIFTGYVTESSNHSASELNEFLATEIPKINYSTTNASNIMGNPYFFPMEDAEVIVKCEFNYFHGFKGEATLQINKLIDTKLDNYYELILTDLKGKCDSHIDTSDPDCEFSGSFSIGYFYADDDHIYLMSRDEGFLEIFKETDVFPPTQEYIDNWNGKLLESGKHYGYFVYRLVCSEEASDDTFGTADGDIRDAMVHNFISIDGVERHYNLWSETSGTQEQMYIFWKKDKGIVYFANWVGSLKNYISFYDSSYEENSMIDWID